MAGTVSLTSQRSEGKVRRAVIELLGDASTGSVPNTTLASLGIFPDGTLLSVTTKPGATNPTAAWSLTLEDDAGIDRLGGACASRSASAAQFVPVNRFASQNQALTLKVTGNSVASANITVILEWVNEAIGNGFLNSDGSMLVGGGVAHDGVDSGNPVKIGGKASSSVPTAVSSLDRVDAWFGVNGQLVASGGYQSVGADGVTGIAPRHDGSNVGGGHAFIRTGFNGASFDRIRNNETQTALASASRSATTNSSDLVNYNGAGVMVVLDCTVQPGGGQTLSLKVQGKDPISGNYFDLADAGIVLTAATGTKVLVVRPGVLAADAASGVTQKSVALSRTYRVVVTHSGAGAWTYSASATALAAG